MQTDNEPSPTESRNVAREATTGFRWLASSRFLTQALMWGITLLVIRLLQPSDYGLIAMTTPIIGVFNMFSEIGLEAALIQAQEVKQRVWQQTFALVLLVNVGFMVLLIAISPLIAAFFQEPILKPIVVVLAAQFPLNALGIVPRTLLLRELLFKQLALATFVSSMMGTIVALAMAWTGFGVWSLVISQLVTTGALTLALYVVRPFFALPIFRFDGLRDVLHFGGAVLAERAAWHFYSTLDNIIIGRLLGKSPVGVYSVAKELASIPVTKSAPILNQIAFPALSRIQHDPTEMNRLCLRGVRLVSTAVFPAAFGLAVVAPELVHAALGSQWSGAVVPLAIIGVLAPMRIVNGVYFSLVRSRGYPRVNLVNTLVGAVLMPTGSAIGCLWGTTGAAAGWALAFPFYIAFCLRQTSKISGLSVSSLVAPLGRPLVLTLGMTTAVAGLRPFVSAFTPTIALVTLVAVGAAVYGLLMILFDKGTLTDLRTIALQR